eukprot:GEMP01017986.1.p1 GENE.GEMP01017986.1~~GEMP01017986.1.p1  ORF type:complete len:385 (+),score=51.11 GEMP01017986.1:166-1320(+)
MGKGGLGKGRGKGESDNFGGSSPPTSPRTPPPKRQSTQESSGVCALPVCGGWCMPTENPDESCFRHFSNEWTIPAQPCFYACMPILEQNKCCFCIGGFGFQIPDGARKGLMCCALCLSFLAMILFALTFFGLHCDADGIKSWYWIKGSGEIGGASITYYMTIFGRFVETSSSDISSYVNGGSEERTQWFPSDHFESESGGYTFDGDDACLFGNPKTVLTCQNCRGYLSNAFYLSIMAMLGQIGAMLANCQRFTPYGDVNCQKCFGLISSIMTMLTAISAYLQFQGCYGQLPERMGSDIAFPPAPEDSTSATSQVTASFTWESSIWMTLVLIGGILKIIDILVHCLVSTPHGRHETPDPLQVDLPDFLLRFNNANKPAVPYSSRR